MTIDREWQATFTRLLQDYENAYVLKDAALDEHLGEWTNALTSVAVKTCLSLGWQASAGAFQSR